VSHGRRTPVKPMIFSWLEDVVRLRGAAHAVIQPDTYLSFRGLVHRANRRMKELAALSIGAGDAVGVMLGNVADYIVLTVALDQLGAALVPLAPLCGGAELDAVWRLVPLRAIIARPGAKVLERSEKERAPHCPAPTARSRLQGSLLSCALFPKSDPLPESTAVVFVTPGAGGDYERVSRTAADLASEAENLALALGVTESDRIGAALPFHHPFGFVFGVTMTLGYGAQLHLDDDLSARRTLARVRDSKLTLVPVSRSLVRELCELPAARSLQGSDVRFLCVEGAVGRDLARSFYRLFKVRVHGGFHRPSMGLLAVDPEGKSPHTVGQPVGGLELRVVDGDGESMTPGRRGRVLVRGPGVASEGDSSGDTPAEAWLDIGERGLVDKQGRLKLLPRTDDLCCVEGLVVSLEEIRQVLLTHPAVEDAAVSLGAATMSGLGDDVVLQAQVVIGRQVTSQRLSGYLAARLSLHKVPERIEIVDKI
jgi:long-chain acyl-CoA synthetase